MLPHESLSPFQQQPGSQPGLGEGLIPSLMRLCSDIPGEKKACRVAQEIAVQRLALLSLCSLASLWQQ